LLSELVGAKLQFLQQFYNFFVIYYYLPLFIVVPLIEENSNIYQIYDKIDKCKKRFSSRSGITDIKRNLFINQWIAFFY